MKPFFQHQGLEQQHYNLIDLDMFQCSRRLEQAVCNQVEYQNQVHVRISIALKLCKNYKSSMKNNKE